MTKYVVLEIQTNADGTIGSLVTSYDNKLEAENKYHTVLAYAAVSNLPVHAAVILTNEGRTVKTEMYMHEQEVSNE